MNKINFLSRLARNQENRKLPEKSILLDEWVLADNSIYSSFYKIPEGFLFRYPRIGDFFVSRDGHLQATHAGSNVSERVLELTFKGEVLPYLLSLQKKLVLHATAITIKDHAIAFLAQTGSGKSTLAACFATHGYSILTDDCLLLDKIAGKFNAHPGQPVVQLYPDSHKVLILHDMSRTPPEHNLHKLPVSLESQLLFCTASLPLHQLYILGPGSAGNISIQALTSAEALIEMSRRTFWLDPEDRELREHQFNQLGCLSREVDSFHLDFPRQYEWLPRVCEAVLVHAEKRGLAGSD